MKHRVLYQVVSLDEPVNGTTLLEHYFASEGGLVLRHLNCRNGSERMGGVYLPAKEALRILSEGQDVEFWRGLEWEYKFVGSCQVESRSDAAPAPEVRPGNATPAAN